MEMYFFNAVFPPNIIDAIIINKNNIVKITTLNSLCVVSHIFLVSIVVFKERIIETTTVAIIPHEKPTL